MKAKEKIIVALDVDNLEKAADLVKILKNHVGYFKIGLELLSAEGAPKVIEMVHGLGGKIFYDGKFKDIPNTIEGSFKAVVSQGIEMINLHCDGGSKMMKLAVSTTKAVALEGIVEKPIILGVTLLTSLNYDDLVEIGIREEFNETAVKDQLEAEFLDTKLHQVTEDQIRQEILKRKKEQVEDFVAKLARLAQNCGLDGVIASPQEIKVIREYCDKKFLVVTPGIRPEWAQTNDQKRIMTPKQAIIAGADYLVIGRPITNPPQEIGDPVKAAQLIAQEIEEGLVLKILEECKAIITDSHIVYSSDKHGREYVNKDAVYPYTDFVSELGGLIAEKAFKFLPDVIIGPAMGGIILSQAVASHLTKKLGERALSVYAEKEGDGFIIKRGYAKLVSGKKVFVVEDVLTTGGSVKKVIEAVQKAGGIVVGVGALCNRGGVKAEDIGAPELFSLINISLDAWDPDECPLCKANVPINTEVGKGREFLAQKGITG
jgi:orotate phosphoribosyltransferase